MNWFLRSGKTQQKLRRFLRKYRVAVIGAAGLGAIGVTQSDLFARFGPLQKLELASLDIRFQQRGQIDRAPQIITVGVDNSSYSPSNIPEEERAKSRALQLISEHPFPWDRRVWPELLERLFALGARVVALDFIFSSQTEADPEFAAVLAKYADRVVLAATVQNNSSGLEGGDGQNLVFLPPHEGLLPADRNIIGHAIFHQDVDNVVRRVNFHTSVMREFGQPQLPDDQELTSFAAAAVERATGHPAPATLGQIINFQGPAEKYPHVPVERVFVKALMEEAPKPSDREIFRDKIVFVGPFAELLHDRLRTPFGEMAGVEVHANVAGDLLMGTLLSETPEWMDLALASALVLLALLAAAAVAHALWQTGLQVALGMGFLVLAQWLFTGQRIVIPMVGPLFAFVATGLFGVVFEFLLEQWERARIRSTLDRYVSKNVAELVLADAGSFEESLRGKKKCVTTLFSDIRGFTTMTESADADELVAQLNEYFLKMVDAVLNQGGTLQKFIGDAIMAVWGDTHSLSLEEDARRAVCAALQMRARLAELNAGWKDHPRRLPLKTGLGIAHAEVVVGNIGHPLRMEFTVLGDGINTAARLESATKQFGCDIMVEAGVERLTREHFIYRQVDLLRLKGKTKAVAVFTPLSDRETPAPAWLADYHRAVALYRSREFAAAEEIMGEVNAALGGDDFLCRMYLSRCRELRAAQPAEDWDGSYVLAEK